MTQQQVIALIQQWIVANGNEEITADVLRPILEAMVNQPNDLMGDLNDLTTTNKDSVVDAINEVNNLSNGGVTIHYGSDTPFITPPVSFELGDYYAQLDGSSVLGFWQYNGNDWIEIKEDTNGVQSVTGDGVSGTPEDVVMTFPTPSEIGALEDAPSDGKQYARKDSDWSEVVIPSSGVQSVTGDGVDNTDPENPFLTFPKEEEITGTRLTNASVTGSTPLDWDAYKVFEFTLTGATTLTDSNLPTGTETKVIELVISGNQVLTLPAYWEALPSNDAYDGTVRNHLVVSCIDGDTNDIIYSLQNLSS